MLFLLKNVNILIILLFYRVMNLSIRQIPYNSTKIYKIFQLNRSLLLKNELNWNSVIRNMIEFKSKFDILKWWHTWRLYEKLLLLKDNLWTVFSNNVDPIEYIIQLYYWEWLTVEDIFIRLNHLWFNYSEKSENPSSVMYNLFTKVFWWELRERWNHTEITKLRNQKIKPKRIEKFLEKHKEDLEETEWVIKSYVDLLLFKNKIIDLSKDEKDQFYKINHRANWKKVLFLLNKFFEINLNQLITLRNNHYLSNKRLSIIITELFKYIPDYLTKDISVTERWIRTIFDFTDRYVD